MQLYALAAIYSLAILIAALAGGWLPLAIRLTHTRMQVALSFVAGVILGIGLLHLIPHGYFELGNIDHTVAWTLAGFLAMFFLERFFPFHQHNAPITEPPRDISDPQSDHDSDAHEHGHDHVHHHDHHHGHSHHGSGRMSWGGAMFGFTLHSIIDGVALGAAMHVETGEAHGGLAGFGTFLAVVLHKPFDSLTIGTLMAASGWSRRGRHIANFLYALIAPLGVLASFLGFQQLEKSYPTAVGAVLCFAGGAFLCIATSDLLPEVQFHRHDRIKLSVSLLLGVALAAAIVLVETSGHEQHHAAGTVPSKTDTTGSILDHRFADSSLVLADSSPRSMRIRRTSCMISPITA